MERRTDKVLEFTQEDVVDALMYWAATEFTGKGLDEKGFCVEWAHKPVGVGVNPVKFVWKYTH
jgi:hypothetical protein